jgi:hypothetical protein
MAGIPAFDPIASVTPFTTRDNMSYLAILEDLQVAFNALIVAVNGANDTNVSEHNRIVSQLTTQFNNALNSLRADMEDRIADMHDESVAWNPTTGNRQDSLSTVVSNVYDNNRIYAWFAAQYDEFGWTAAEYDAKELTARTFDLVPSYPTINAVRTV